LKPAERVRAFLDFALKEIHHSAYTDAAYPSNVLDIVLFHKLHLSMSWKDALKSYKQLGEEFVDWNEVRVSSVREIQDQLRGADRSLELAVFIKDFLEIVQKERHSLCLEFLEESTLTEVRRFFRPVKGVDSASAELVLLRRKGHPVVPLTPDMEAVAEHLGLVSKTGTRDQRQKQLHDELNGQQVLELHHFLLDLSRQLCPDGADGLKIPPLPSRDVGPFLNDLVKKAEARAAKAEARRVAQDLKKAAAEEKKEAAAKATKAPAPQAKAPAAKKSAPAEKAKPAASKKKAPTAKGGSKAAESKASAAKKVRKRTSG